MTAFHVRVPPNPQGRDFVIGDLHGHCDALEGALERERFDPTRDRLFSVGDLVDRGPDSPGAAALIAEPWFHAVRGNHEDMLLRAPAGERDIADVWRANGGGWALEGEGVNAAGHAAGALCARLPLALTIEHRSGRRFGVCHAEYPVEDWSLVATLAGNARAREQMLWGRTRIRRDQLPAVRGVDWTIHGHTIVDAPLRVANALFIDTGVCTPGGRLTLLCLDDI